MKTFSTKHLTFAAYLHMLGETIIDVQPDPTGPYQIFVFNENPDILHHKKKFFAKEVAVEPVQFMFHIRQVRKLINRYTQSNYKALPINYR